MSDGFKEIGKVEAEQAPAKFFQFKEIGDWFIGKLVAVQEGVQGTYGPETHYIFLTKNEKGEAEQIVVNATADLRKRYSVAKIGGVYRTMFAETKDIGKPSPMKIHVVGEWDGKTPIAQWRGRAVTSAPVAQTTAAKVNVDALGF